MSNPVSLEWVYFLRVHRDDVARRFRTEDRAGFFVTVKRWNERAGLVFFAGQRSQAFAVALPALRRVRAEKQRCVGNHLAFHDSEVKRNVMAFETPPPAVARAW